MFKAIAQLFTALTVLFQSAERGANAINHLAEAAELHAQKYRDDVADELQKSGDI